MAADTIELDDEAWAKARNSMTERFLGISADEFVMRYERGDYDRDEPDLLMDVLALFPELD